MTPKEAVAKVVRLPYIDRKGRRYVERVVVESIIRDITVPTADLDRLRTALTDAITAIRTEARRTKTVYGGSDFAPVDYKVLTGSPASLTKIADGLEAALAPPLTLEERDYAAGPEFDRLNTPDRDRPRAVFPPPQRPRERPRGLCSARTRETDGG